MVANNAYNYSTPRGSIHYQTVPLSSYSNILSSFMGPTGTQVGEDVKMVLTDQELSELDCKKMSEVEREDESDYKCTVCLESVKEDESVIVLKCKHIFHEKCIKTWLTKCSNKCPVCREVVANGVPDYTRGGSPR